jgi:Mg2+ and Co2+ transporter CorA
MTKIVPDTWELPAKLRNRVGGGVGRQRMLAENGHALLLLHACPRERERERRGAAFWRLPDGEWRCAPGKDGFRTLCQHVEAFATELEKLDARVEAAHKASDFFAILRHARPVHRCARNMHAAITLLRDAQPDDADVLALRNRAYEIERWAETITGDAENGMEFTVAQHTEEQATMSERILEETHRLNMLAATFMPITALGAILGMNVTSGLEALPAAVFWLIVVAAALTGFFVRGQVRKRG